MLKAPETEDLSGVQKNQTELVEEEIEEESKAPETERSFWRRRRRDHCRATPTSTHSDHHHAPEASHE